MSSNVVEVRLLILKKEGHRYIFFYRSGDEVALFYAFMKFAVDSRFNITVHDLTYCTSTLLKNNKQNAVIDLDAASSKKIH